MASLGLLVAQEYIMRGGPERGVSKRNLIMAVAGRSSR